MLLAAASLLALLAFAGVASAAKSGGTLRINLESDTDYTDPALAYYQISWQFEYQTCVKLLNYPDKAAPEGSKLIPEAASALPVVSNGGKTYTFTVPAGKYKFSPPSNKPVTANTFKTTMYRLLNPAMQSPAAAGGFYNDIVGANDYINGKSKSISGIKVKGNKISFTLTDAGPRLHLADGHAVHVRRPGQHEGRPERRHAVRGRPVLHRVVHAEAADRAQAEPELPRDPPAQLQPDRLHGGR